MLHAFILRRLSKTLLSILVLIAGAALIQMAVTSPTGDIIGGWSLEPAQLRIGLTRLLFPYMAGMLLRRVVPIGEGRTHFLITSLLLITVLSVPRIGGHEYYWANGLYDSLSIILVFPVIIYLGAFGKIINPRTEKLCTFLGDISYPVYITHFPIMYIFYAWVSNNNIPIEEGYWVGIILLPLTILLAYAILKLYDEAVRQWLAGKFLTASAKKRNKG